MKQDQYIPHELNTRNTTEVIHLIEEQGMAGYGIYWCLLEYLRTQDNYKGDFRVLKPLARRMKVRLSKLLSILQDYGLFICDDYSFHSPKLLELMAPLEERRARIRAYKEKKQSCNSLEISTTPNTVKKSKEEKSKVKKSKEETSSTEEAKNAAADAVLLSPVRLAWEEYVDELDKEQQWKEIMAMRTGLKKEFFNLYPRIAACFKDHVLGVVGGKEHPFLQRRQALLLLLPHPRKQHLPAPHDPAQAVWNGETGDWKF